MIGTKVEYQVGLYFTKSNLMTGMKTEYHIGIHLQNSISW